MYTCGDGKKTDYIESAATSGDWESCYPRKSDLAIPSALPPDVQAGCADSQIGFFTFWVRGRPGGRPAEVVHQPSDRNAIGGDCPDRPVFFVRSLPIPYAKRIIVVLWMAMIQDVSLPRKRSQTAP